jgi:DNA-binding response OmpR family regulator
MTMATVLLVEDDEEIHDLLKRYLEKENLHVVSAHDGDTALARLADTPCQLAVLDLMIPGADGYEVLGEIRRQGERTVFSFALPRWEP